MNKLRTIIVSILMLAGLTASPLALAAPTFAAQVNPQQEACLGTGGSWNGSTCTGNSNTPDLAAIIKTIVNILLFIIGAVAVIMIIVGGFRYVTSAGNASSVTAAKNTILYAVVGLVIALLAYAIVNFVLKSI